MEGKAQIPVNVLRHINFDFIELDTTTVTAV